MKPTSPTTRQPGALPEHAGVDLWLAALDGGGPDPRRWLAPDEAARADGFRDAIAAARYAAARSTLREILGDYLGCHPGALRLDYGESGKPALSGHHTPELHFNVSHSGGHAIYAVCRTAEVGVDIEHDDGRVDPGALARTICSPDELRYFQAQPPGEQRDAFFRLWTRTEAYLKCLGYGLALAPRRVEMPIADDPEVFAGDGAARCAIRTLPLATGWQASIAARSGGVEVRSFRWWPSRLPVRQPRG